MTKHVKRLITLVLSLAMVITMLPTGLTVYAAEESAAEDEAAYWAACGNYYYYNQLTPEEKVFWEKLEAECIRLLTTTDQIYIGAYNGTNPVDFAACGLDEAAACKVAEFFCLSNPQYYFLNSKVVKVDASKLALEIPVQWGPGAARKTATSNLKTKLDAKVTSLEGKFTETTTTEEKAKMIYNHVISLAQTVYEDNGAAAPNKDSIYGALLQSADHLGFAAKFTVLCNRLGVDAITVMGEYENGSPIYYNKVRIEDNWYNISCSLDQQATVQAALPYGTYIYDHYLRSNPMFCTNFAPKEAHAGYLPASMLDSGSGGTNQNALNPVTATAAVPVISVVGGCNAQVTITGEDADQIYYTLDGTAPAVMKKGTYRYTAPFAITDPNTTKIHAVAVSAGKLDSEVLEGEPIHTLSFDGNGSTGGEMKGIVSCTESDSGSYTLPKNEYTRTRGTFTGWNTKADGTGKDFADGAAITAAEIQANRTLYAQWDMEAIEEYKITYHLDGGTNHADNPAAYTGQAAITLQNPTRADYKFEGWYTDAAFTEQVTEIPQGTVGDVELWAKWKEIEWLYMIDYELNGGKNNSSNPSLGKSTLSYLLKNPTKAGYTFEGWYTDAAFTPSKKLENNTIPRGNADDITVYAKWKEGSSTGGTGDSGNTGGTMYKITYHLDGGVNHKDNPSEYNAQGKNIDLKSPTKKGYWSSWYTDPECTNYISEIRIGTTGDLDLYVKWKPITYKLVFMKNGGTGYMADQICEYDADCSINENSFTNYGKAFKGWNTKINGTGTTYTDKAQIKNLADKSNVTIYLYAQWGARVPNKITYYLNKGTNSKDNPSTYMDKNVVLKNPTRKGYAFQGWYTDSKFKMKITIIGALSRKDFTLYAKWAKVSAKASAIKSAKNSKSKQLAVVCKKLTDVKGYEISYTTDKKLKKSVFRKTTNKTSYIIKGLKKGKTYYVRVRTYKVDSKGLKVYSKYSKVKKVKIKK